MMKFFLQTAPHTHGWESTEGAKLDRKLRFPFSLLTNKRLKQIFSQQVN